MKNEIRKCFLLPVSIVYLLTLLLYIRRLDLEKGSLFIFIVIKEYLYTVHSITFSFMSFLSSFLSLPSLNNENFFLNSNNIGSVQCKVFFLFCFEATIYNIKNNSSSSFMSLLCCPSSDLIGSLNT